MHLPTKAPLEPQSKQGMLRGCLDTPFSSIYHFPRQAKSLKPPVHTQSSFPCTGRAEQVSQESS